MNRRLTIAALTLGAATCGLGACATAPQFPIDPETGAPVRSAQREGDPASGPGSVAMAPIPNPGEGGRPYRQPGRVSSSELPPVSGARSAPPEPVRASEAVDRPATYRVQAGETLFSISRRFQLSPQALADANDMTFQSILRNGQTLRIPGGRDSAPVRMARNDPPPPPIRERAREPERAPPGVTPTPPPASARVSTPVPNPGSGSSPVSGRARPDPRRPNLAREQAPPPSSAAPIIPTAPTPSSSDVAALGRGLFRWPTDGAVTGRFGPGSGGQRNDGIDIAGTLGAPVTAAAAGEVAYSGSSIPGFGNLVLVRHPGGWVTAYGHLQSSAVHMRQAVTQGMQIGAVGQTGNVTSPSLHFEIRYAPSARDRARPVDPLTLLPER